MWKRIAPDNPHVADLRRCLPRRVETKYFPTHFIHGHLFIYMSTFAAELTAGLTVRGGIRHRFGPVGHTVFVPRHDEHTANRAISTHGDGTAAIALLWHGRGPLESYALAPLADAVAASGIRVLAADWDSTSPDLGRADLESSLAYARRTADELAIDPSRVVLVGWSLGATAALGLALRSAEPLRTVLIAPGYAPRALDAFSGQPLPETFPPGRGSIDVLWGNRDDLVDEAMATSLVERLRTAGWLVSATEVDADHSGVVGMRFDETTDRYVSDHGADAALATVAAAIVAAATP